MSMLFKRIKDWATSITSFRTGDVIPVDGPSGTAKMSKDDLLKETAQGTFKNGIAPQFSTGIDYALRDLVCYDGKVYRFKKDHPAGAWDVNDVDEYSMNGVIERVGENALTFALNGRNIRQQRIFGLDSTRYYIIKSNDSWDYSDTTKLSFEIAYTTNGTDFIRIYEATGSVNGANICFKPIASALFYIVFIRNENGNFVNFCIEPEANNFTRNSVKSSDNVSRQSRIYTKQANGVVVLKIDCNIPDDYASTATDNFEIAVHKKSTNTFKQIVQYRQQIKNIPHGVAIELTSDIDFINLWLRTNDEVYIEGTIEDNFKTKDVSDVPVFTEGLLSNRNNGLDVTSSLNASCSPVYCKGAVGIYLSLDVSVSGVTDAGICFYDEQMNFISSYASTDASDPYTIREYLVIPPKGAAYFRTSIYTMYIKDFKCVLYFADFVDNSEFSLYKKDENVRVGVPQLYLSEPTSAEYVELNNVHTSELYAKYDELVASYPYVFTRQADLGNVTRTEDGEVFAIRSYRLDFTKKALFDHEPGDNEVVTSSNNSYAKYHRKPRKILVNGGMHGEEKTPCWGLMLSIKAILESSDPWATFIKNNFVFEIIPCLNPAGWDMCRRGNCNNLGLNRDEAINEPETLMYMDWIAANKDAFILIDVHGTQGRFAYAPVNRAEPICDQVLKTTLQLSTFFYPNWKEFWESQYAGYGTTYAPFLLAKFSKMDESSWTLGRLNYRMFHECGMREFAIETPDNFFNGAIGSNDLRNCKITKDLFINYLQFVCGSEKIRM